MSTETTPAIERLAKVLDPDAFALRSPENRALFVPPALDRARMLLAVALDPWEMARAADPKAFEDHPIEQRSRPAALQWAMRRKIATDHAKAIRASILGTDQ